LIEQWLMYALQRTSINQVELLVSFL
jgi:hypothetical protein